MKRIRFLIFLVLFAPGLSQAQAVDLYSASVPVVDQSQYTREAAFPAALTQVLGKLSGLRDFEAYPEVQPAVQNARSLVVSFHYRQVQTQSQPGGERVGQPAGTPAETHLVARFSEEGVDELMRTLGLPRWPVAREPLEIWVLIDDGVSRRVLPLEFADLRPLIDRVAEARGLPLSWPRADAEGTYGVDLQLLWGGYTETVAGDDGEANVLVVAARREGVEWSTRLVLEYEGDHWSWRVRDIDLERALTGAMHQVIDEIAAAQAIAPSDQGSWIHEIAVAGVNSGDDYTRCLVYLESLGIVDDVAVEAADSRSVRMVLTLNAAPEYFEQVVDEGRVLESGESTGHYVLQP